MMIQAESNTLEKIKRLCERIANQTTEEEMVLVHLLK